MTFEEELETRNAALEEARENRAQDPEGWNEIKTEYAEWRRAIRMLGGRPLGDPPWPPDVVEFAASHGIQPVQEG